MLASLLLSLARIIRSEQIPSRAAPFPPLVVIAKDVDRSLIPKNLRAVAIRDLNAVAQNLLSRPKRPYGEIAIHDKGCGRDSAPVERWKVGHIFNDAGRCREKSTRGRGAHNLTAIVDVPGLRHDETRYIDRV